MKKSAFIGILTLLCLCAAAGEAAPDDWRDWTIGEWQEAHALNGTFEGLPPEFAVFVAPGEGEIAAGSQVFLGAWEQDGRADNGPEPIEWLVLDVQDGQALLLSRYALACRPFHSERTDVTWETCELRQWLNGEFLETALTEEERRAVPRTPVPNDASQGNFAFETEAGNDTEDRVFTLSFLEVKNLLGTDQSLLQARPTAAAKRQGAFVSDSSSWPGFTWWWLRSPGPDQRGACVVHASGGYGGSMHYLSVRNDEACVRPALRADLKADALRVASFPFLTDLTDVTTLPGETEDQP